METIKLVGIGLVLGIANVIPGVSGGTIAVVFAVYDRLIAVITPDIKKIAKAWKFWLPLGAGIGGGIIFFSNLITFLFDAYPIPTTWFFIGVILGSLPMLYRRVHAPDAVLPPLSGILCFLAAFALMTAMKIIRPEEETPVYTVLTPSLFGILASAGALAATAMIIPGVSGSFLLIVTGMYQTIIQGVSDMNIPLLLPVALGVGAGLLAGAALIRVLMAKAPYQTYGAILGLVAGSIILLFPGSFGTGSLRAVSILTLLIGAGLSFAAAER